MKHQEKFRRQPRTKNPFASSKQQQHQVSETPNIGISPLKRARKHTRRPRLQQIQERPTPRVEPREVTREETDRSRNKFYQLVSFSFLFSLFFPPSHILCARKCGVAPPVKCTKRAKIESDISGIHSLVDGCPLASGWLAKTQHTQTRPTWKKPGQHFFRFSNFFRKIAKCPENPPKNGEI